MTEFDNDGAMMDVDETLMCKFIKVKPQSKPNGLAKKGTFTGQGAGRGFGGRAMKSPSAKSHF